MTIKTGAGAAIIVFVAVIAIVWFTLPVSFSGALFEEESSVSSTTKDHSAVPDQSGSALVGKSVSRSEDLRFEDFPVTDIYRGKHASLKYQDDELGYKAPLDFAIKNQEVDFAGHYIATNWSCGMWCATNAFIDVKTGQVYWSPVRTEVCLPHLANEFACDENFTSVNYKLDSELIIFFGFRSVTDEVEEKGFHYYQFKNGTFHHLKSVPVKDQRSARQVQLDEFDENRNR